MNELLEAMMSMKKKTIHPLKPRTCQVLEDEARACASANQKMTYVECDACGGRIEVWNDEDTSSCLDCGAEWIRENK
jgi:predicted RNA-binding Zn-ribbon protein involved in translation (DUF1610 family)